MPNTVKGVEIDPVREKLIELCEDVILSCKSSLCADCEHNCVDYPNCMGVHFADHLIANGVTLDNQVSSSKWIPVTERLPKAFELVLVYRATGCEVENCINVEKGIWLDDNISDYPVTHWMPLPEAPKGE